MGKNKVLPKDDEDTIAVEEKQEVAERWREWVDYFEGDISQAFEYAVLGFADSVKSRLALQLRLSDLPPVDAILSKNFRVLYVYWSNGIQVSNKEKEKLQLAKVGSCDCYVDSVEVDLEADPPTRKVQAHYSKKLVSVTTPMDTRIVDLNRKWTCRNHMSYPFEVATWFVSVRGKCVIEGKPIGSAANLM